MTSSAQADVALLGDDSSRSHLQRRIGRSIRQAQRQIRQPPNVRDCRKGGEIWTRIFLGLEPRHSSL